MLFSENILNKQQFDDFLLIVLEIPHYFGVYFTDIEKIMPKNKFIENWKKNYSHKNSKQICFDLITKHNKNQDFMIRENLDPLLISIIEDHPDYDLIRDD